MKTTGFVKKEEKKPEKKKKMEEKKKEDEKKEEKKKRRQCATSAPVLPRPGRLATSIAARDVSSCLNDRRRLGRTMNVWRGLFAAR